MNTSRPLLLAALLVCTAQAHAQIQRCTDARGHVTYTNAACPKGQQARVVVPAMSAEERARQNANYQAALQRRQQERALYAQQQAEQYASDAARAAQAAQAAAAIAATKRPQRPNPTVVIPLYRYEGYNLRTR